MVNAKICRLGSVLLISGLSKRSWKVVVMKLNIRNQATLTSFNET